MDEGRKLTDDLLAQMERKVAQEYRQASKEVAKKLDDYLEAFARKDEKKRKQLQAGEITKKEYEQWRVGQIMIGQRWSEMKETLAEDYHNANNIANSIVNGYMPEVYALNHNYGTYEVEHASMLDTSYTLYDRQTVERLMRDDPNMLPPPGKRTSARIAAGQDILWNKQQIQSVMMQSLLQGEAIPKIAKRLATTVGDKNYASAVRNARTMTTGAENAGRVNSYKRAQDMGIEMGQMWIAALDMRTRSSHVELDGEVIPVGGTFSNGLKFPGDPSGRPEEVYNCRCTLIAQLKGFEINPADLGLRNDSKLGSMSYEEWKENKWERQYKKIGKGPKNWKDSIINNTEGQESGILYSTYGLRKPKRPVKSDFENEDDYEKARDEYRALRKEYEALRDDWIVRNTPVHSMTDEEIRTWCAGKGIKIYNDISPVDGRALTAYTERMNKLSEDFPEVMQYRKLLNLPPQFQSYELAYEDTWDFYAEASHGFTFGNAGKDVTLLMRLMCDDIAEGRLVEGDGPLNSLFDHEFGHNVYDYMVASGIAEKSVLRNDLIKTLSGKEGISEYAATVNDHEMFAEGFSAWYGGANTDFARSMGMFLKKWGMI